MSIPTSVPRQFVSRNEQSHSTVCAVPWWLWAGLAIALFAFFVRAQKSDDDVRFWDYVTQCAHDGQWPAIYDKASHPFAFHPYGNLSGVMLLYPLGYLSKPVMRLALTAIILGMWYALYRVMYAGVTDRRWGFVGGVPLAAGGPLLGMILAGRFLLNDLNLKQLNTITFVSGCLGMFLMLGSRRFAWQIVGAIFLAFSIGLKLTTLPLLAMLVIKRGWWQAGIVAIFSFGVLWLVPELVLGHQLHAELSRLVEGNSMNMWLQIEDTTQTWSFVNFIHYRVFIDPIWPGLAALSPRSYQAICVIATLLIGLPALHVMLRRRWSETTPTHLWQELAMVGVAWALIDPDGRTAHFVTMVPAYGLIIHGRLNAWHRYRELPSVWEWLSFAVICLTNLWLIRLADPVAHHFYMHYGLFSLGMFVLYAMTYRDIQLADRRAALTTDGTRRIDRDGLALAA